MKYVNHAMGQFQIIYDKVLLYIYYIEHIVLIVRQWRPEGLWRPGTKSFFGAPPSPPPQ